MCDLFWLPNCNIRRIQFWVQIFGSEAFNFGPRSAISNIIFMINKLELLWVLNFIALRIFFIFGTKFSWNEETDTCFNVECVLFGQNFDLFSGYCSLPSGCCWLLLVTWWLLLVNALYWWLLLVITRYCSLPLLVWTILYTNLSLPRDLVHPYCCVLWKKCFERSPHFMSVISIIILQWC